jgi:hypothetical protein
LGAGALLVPVVVSFSLLVDIFERGGLVVVLEFRTLNKIYRIRIRISTWKMATRDSTPLN